MHHMALQLAPVLAAEKSKVPFYIAGGLLVAWALVVSLALGLRRPEFPGNQSGERAVIAITVVLVLAAISSAVLTSGSSPTAKAAISPLPVAPNPAVPSTAPASTSSSASQAPASTGAAQPPAKSGAAPTPAKSGAAPTPAKSGATTSLKLAADAAGLLSFDSKLLSAKSGMVTIAFTNASPVEHNVTVAQGSTVVGATPTFTGGAKTLTVKLKPGTYTFYCTVPGHRQAGMEGTLKVS
jgi:plastocyanin